MKISDSYFKRSLRLDKKLGGIEYVYNIASWSIDVVKQHKQITLSVFLDYLLEFLSYCPWIYVQSIGLSDKEGLKVKFESKSNEDFFEFCENLKNGPRANELIDNYTDLGLLRCGFLLEYEGRTHILREYNEYQDEIEIHAQYYTCAGSPIYFYVSFSTDVFFENPSEQEDVYLSKEIVEWNRTLLRNSLIAIDSSDTFEISFWKSDLYPKYITKFGFEVP